MWPPRNPLHIARRYVRDAWLAEVVGVVRPKVMVETGIFHGRSATALLAASESWGGRLWSIDISPATPDGVAVGKLVPPALRRRWTVLIGDSAVELPRVLDKLGTVDLFLHDSDHTFGTMTREYTQAWPHLRDGGALASDDVKMNDAFSRFAEGVHRRAEIWYSPYGEQAAIFA